MPWCMYQYQQQTVAPQRRPAPPRYSPEETEREKTNQLLQDRFGNHLLQQGLSGEGGLPALAMDSLEGVDAWLSSNGMAIACMKGAAPSGAEFQMPQTPGRPLPEALRLAMEAYFQHRFSGVLVHDDRATQCAVAALGAQAFAAGRHIYLTFPISSWETPVYYQVLRHELAHVVQYDKGKILPGILDNQDSLEMEATSAEDSAAWIDRLLEEGGGSRIPGVDGPLWDREEPEICSRWANEGLMAPAENDLLLSAEKQHPVHQELPLSCEIPGAATSYQGYSYPDLLDLEACGEQAAVDGGVILPAPSTPSLTATDQLQLLQMSLEELHHELRSHPEKHAALGSQIYVSMTQLDSLAQSPALRHLSWMPLHPFWSDLLLLKYHFPKLISPIPDVTTAIAVAGALADCSSTGSFLYASEDSIFTMIQNRWIADFDHYFTVRLPVITGDPDYQSYIAARRDDGVDPLRYANALPDVRSLHWFLKDVLDKLVADRWAPGHHLPVTVMLLSAHDHNGALQRDAATSAVILDPGHRVLLAQGMGAISEFQPLLEEWAATYTDDGQFEEVLFDGHGNPLGMELAARSNEQGEREEEELSYTGATASETHRLMAWLGEHVEVGGAVGLSACSTNAEPFTAENLPRNLDIWGEYPPPLSTASDEPSWEDVRRQILEPTTFAEQLALDFPNQQVRGASGLLRSRTERDAQGDLRVTSPYDPDIFGDKVRYISTGHDPEGVVKALLQVVAFSGLETALMLIRNRVVAPSPGALPWDDRVVRWTFELILRQFSDQPHEWLPIGERSQPLTLLSSASYKLTSCEKGLGYLISGIEDLVNDLYNPKFPLSIRLRLGQLIAKNGFGQFVHLCDLLDRNDPDHTIPNLDGGYLGARLEEAKAYDISSGSLILVLLWHKHTRSADAKAWLEAALQKHPQFQGISASADILRRLPYIP